MAQDLAGMLTGISPQGIDPRMNMQQQQLALGANASRMMQGGIRGMTGQQTNQEQLKVALGSLDPVKDADKIAKILMAKGDYAGAARIAKGAADAAKLAKATEGTADRLVERGMPEQAKALMEGEMTLAQGQQLVITTDGERRRAEAAEKNQKVTDAGKKETSINQQVALVSAFGLKDTPFFSKVRAGHFGGMSAEAFKIVADVHRKAESSEINVQAQSQYTLENGTTVWGGMVEVGDTPAAMLYQANDGEGGVTYLPLPAGAKRVTTSKTEDNKGIETAKQDLTDAEAALEIAVLEEGGSNNNAWTNLVQFKKTELINMVAQRTKELTKAGTDEYQARQLAVKEIFLKNVTEVDGIVYGTNTVYKPTPEVTGLDPEATSEAVANAPPTAEIPPSILNEYPTAQRANDGKIYIKNADGKYSQVEED